jgi:hypothetical protein
VKTQTTILLLLMLLTELCPMAAGTANKPRKDADLMAGNSHLAKNRYADALQCYRKAAREGPEGAMQVGQLLLFGKESTELGQSVPPDTSEGIQWTFWAATNRNAQACRNLANAFELGIGVKTNLVYAYVWQRVAKEADQTSSMESLDRLASQLDAQEISAAQELAKHYYGGAWPVCPVRKVVRGDARLTLNGTTAGGRAPLAVINNRSIAEGETGEIITPKGPLAVTCVEVSASSVLIEVAGENEAHLLELP